MAVELPVIHSAPAPQRAPESDPEPRRLVARARLLARAGLVWHGIEAAVAIAAGAVAGSIALIAFGADSLIEALAGIIVLWRFAATRADSETRRAARATAHRDHVLAPRRIRHRRGDHHPRQRRSPRQQPGRDRPLDRHADRDAAPRPTPRRTSPGELGSSAGHSESRQNMLCAYLSAALLIGLTLNAALGWWWADPLTALVIAAVAAREGRESWRGESCCTIDGCC